MRQVILATALLALPACGDPLAGLTRITEVDMAPGETTAQAFPSDEDAAGGNILLTDAAQTGADGSEPPLAQERPPSAMAAPAPPRRGGFLGLFRRSGTAPAPEQGTEDAAVASALRDANAREDAADGTVEIASLDRELPDAVAAPPPRRGLLGLLSPGGAGRKPLTGSEVTDVRFRTELPYGAVARVCEARGQGLGRKIEAAPVRGYKIYDSNPDVDRPRTWYITGFPDGCPRQITAANVILAAPSFYEQLRYGPAGAHLAYGATDKAYEKLKRRICGTGKGKPCGSKIKQLDRSTFFVTSYARMDENAQWSELLIHDGAVIASALKSND